MTFFLGSVAVSELAAAADVALSVNVSDTPQMNGETVVAREIHEEITTMLSSHPADVTSAAKRMDAFGSGGFVGRDLSSSAPLPPMPAPTNSDGPPRATDCSPRRPSMDRWRTPSDIPPTAKPDMGGDRSVMSDPAALQTSRGGWGAGGVGGEKMSSSVLASAGPVEAGWGGGPKSAPSNAASGWSGASSDTARPVEVSRPLPTSGGWSGGPTDTARPVEVSRPPPTSGGGLSGGPTETARPLTEESLLGGTAGWSGSSGNLRAQEKPRVSGGAGWSGPNDVTRPAEPLRAPEQPRANDAGWGASCEVPRPVEPSRVSEQPRTNGGAGWGGPTEPSRPKEPSRAPEPPRTNGDAGLVGSAGKPLDSRPGSGGGWGASAEKPPQDSRPSSSGGWGASAEKAQNSRTGSSCSWGASAEKPPQDSRPSSSGGWGASAEKPPQDSRPSSSGGWGASAEKPRAADEYRQVNNGGRNGSFDQYGSSTTHSRSGGGFRDSGSKDSGQWNSSQDQSRFGGQRASRYNDNFGGDEKSRKWNGAPSNASSQQYRSSFGGPSEQSSGYDKSDNFGSSQRRSEGRAGGMAFGNDEQGEYPARNSRDEDIMAEPAPKANLAPRSSEFTTSRNEELETALFESQMRTGINFSKYDQIPVKVSGSFATPKPISSFEEAPLHDHIRFNVKLAKYKIPTPVQKHGLPIILGGHDLMSCAQTGSGKTAAFLLPMLSKAMEDGLNTTTASGYRAKIKPFAVILAPTRELACQIFDEARKFSYRTGVRPCVVYGGTRAVEQLQDLEKGCHVLIATPGRLKDFIDRGRISFGQVRFLVVDEADRMLDMGFEVQLRYLITETDLPSPQDRQTMMFSATFPAEIQRLASEFLRKDYFFLTVGHVGGACENIEQRIIQLRQDEKRDYLCRMLQEIGRSRTADSLDDYLFNRGFPSTSIHGDRSQEQREAALYHFKKVATDVASRGLDIPSVGHVIVYDMPSSIDDYVHRIGRTARAGNTGTATAFFTDSDGRLSSALITILENAGQSVPQFLRDMGDYGGGGGRDAFGGQDERYAYGRQREDRWNSQDQRIAHNESSGGDRWNSQDQRGGYGESKADRNNGPSKGDRWGSQDQRGGYGESKAGRNNGPGKGDRWGSQDQRGGYGEPKSDRNNGSSGGDRWNSQGGYAGGQKSDNSNGGDRWGGQSGYASGQKSDRYDNQKGEDRWNSQGGYSGGSSGPKTGGSLGAQTGTQPRGWE